MLINNHTVVTFNTTLLDLVPALYQFFPVVINLHHLCLLNCRLSSRVSVTAKGMDGLVKVILNHFIGNAECC